jgi:DNA polymerase III subunit delta
LQLAAAQLSNHLSKGLRSLYTLHGDETLLVQEAADAIRAEARKQGFTERSSFTVAGAHFDWGEVLAAAGSMGLFADKQIIEIRIPSGKPGKDGSVQLQQLAAQAAENTDTLTLVMLPKLDKMSKQGAWFTALDGNGVNIEIQPVERAALPQWIAQRLQAQGQQVAAGVEGQQTLQFFTDRVEGNLLAAFQEIQKLGLLHPKGELSLAQVESAVLNVARYDVFKLSESVLAGHPARVQRMLDGLQAEGVAEVLVHWAISEDIRSLKRVKERLFERVLPQLSSAALIDLLEAAHKVDGIVKGLKQRDWPQDSWQALHRLAMQLCQACMTQTAASAQKSTKIAA